jgi:AraC family transcriptional regulator of adaptative response/methylated-DNA-[protein]-cysteine methyltransferase
MSRISCGVAAVDNKINSSYQSNTAFGDLFTKIIEGSYPYRNNNYEILKASMFDTLLGPMLAIADERALFLLEFMDKRSLEERVEKLRKRTKSLIVPGATGPIDSIEKELKSYFDGNLKNFKTALNLTGSSFQEAVWSELCQISYGETKSYAEQASSIQRQSAYRAVANANGANKIIIVIPCHRVVRGNGALGGYGAGIDRKRWLLEHEQKNR